MTHAYERIRNGIVRVMYSIAGVAILGMIIITVSDVSLRLFRMPINGAYELVSFLGALAISFAIAQTCVEKGHVAVSFVLDRLSTRVKAMVKSLTNLMSFILFFAISWQSLVYGNELRLSGELSPTLQFPFYPIVYGICFATWMVCLVIAVDLIGSIRKVVGK
jgi:TRAP-type C4-dicarboxylate transport system permease small subunit